jgi:hypothetical protein
VVRITKEQILCTVIINNETKNEIQQKIDAGLTIEQIINDLGISIEF